MKKLINLIFSIMCITALFTVTFSSCSDDDENRAYESVQIVGVKVNNELYTPSSVSATETTVLIPAGVDLSKAKLQLLVINGTANFINDQEYDARKPLDLTLNGFDGTTVQTKLRIQSPPKLVSFIIEGMTVPNSDIHTGEESLIVQVPEEADLTALKVTMEYINGTIMDFQNGVALDYTNPRSFKIKGVDEETIYTYEFIITTEKVGPASIKAMTINGIETDYVLTDDKNVAVPYIPALMDFTSVNVELTAGFGNKIDESFTGQGLNLMNGNNKVSIKGSNGVTTEFTIGIPQISAEPTFKKNYTELVGFGSDNLICTAISDPYIVASNHSSSSKTPAYFDYTGNKIDNLSAVGLSIATHGIRILATDDKGNILGAALGTDKPVIYRWSNVTAKATEFISFDKSVIGETATPRLAGISIIGDLDGDATIVAPKAQSVDVFVWKVIGGVLNPVPQKYTFPVATPSFYWTVNPMPIGMSGYMGFYTAKGANGLIWLNSTMGEVSRMSGLITTGGDMVKIENRVYVAYTVYADSKGIMRICDITDGKYNQIFNYTMEASGANGNSTTSASLMVKNNELYAVFGCTGSGLYFYRIACK
ncbi:DUF5018 domain-containing protein [Bacteroides xylanisolvens]|jgi:hypothetical protein|uniref:DUF5018 domain-containing protein n=1 Tax=Bacteroides xylanisolvens TaxID=371601 RepID=UPI001C279009|nr:MULTISPECIES: DUF5018 domain-containing protein [Bacteroides]MBU9953757.1 DUF5018 domain-containing protein [Bacteroides sp. MSK.20.12]MBV3451847.1 DUF5018 domain-containing protein [Bacteroides xylanisolvens]MBV4222874.1 DUF5018 domain-containing protein [Bacteroides xylanisolvens]